MLNCIDIFNFQFIINSFQMQIQNRKRNFYLQISTLLFTLISAIMLYLQIGIFPSKSEFQVLNSQDRIFINLFLLNVVILFLYNLFVEVFVILKVIANLINNENEIQENRHFVFTSISIVFYYLILNKMLQFLY